MERGDGIAKAARRTGVIVQELVAIDHAVIGGGVNLTITTAVTGLKVCELKREVMQDDRLPARHIADEDHSIRRLPGDVRNVVEVVDDRQVRYLEVSDGGFVELDNIVLSSKLRRDELDRGAA